jgi:hypothetical protein
MLEQEQAAWAGLLREMKALQARMEVGAHHYRNLAAAKEKLEWQQGEGSAALTAGRC